MNQKEFHATATKILGHAVATAQVQGDSYTVTIALGYGNASEKAIDYRTKITSHDEEIIPWLHLIEKNLDEQNEKYKPGITMAADLLEDGLKQYVPLQEWRKPPKVGDSYTNPWMYKDVEPIFIDYDTKSLKVLFSIAEKGGQVLVSVEVPWRQWKSGIERNLVASIADKAMALCNFCWDNRILQTENAYPNILIRMEV